MKATIEKIEIAAVFGILAVAGTLGTLWMLKALHSALYACAAFEPQCPII
jgi:hypothetical protein